MRLVTDALTDRVAATRTPVEGICVDYMYFTTQYHTGPTSNT